MKYINILTQELINIKEQKVPIGSSLFVQQNFSARIYI